MKYFNRQTLANLYELTKKELKSLLSDSILLAMIVFVFTVVIVIINQGMRLEVHNATVAFVDEDQSALSFNIIQAIQGPEFQAPQAISREQINQALDHADFTFVLVIPAQFEADMTSQREPKIQLLVDATAMTHAGMGTLYLEEIIRQASQEYFKQPSPNLPVDVIQYLIFNQNADPSWLFTVMQIITNITLTGLVLVGAAVIREKERGTIEHLLVMPVTAFEIAVAKIIANGLVILVVSTLSLYFVVHIGLGIPIRGSIGLFILASTIFLFSMTALGMLLATFTPSLPQFGLVVTIFIIVINLSSGLTSPLENLGPIVQKIAHLQPATYFQTIVSSTIFRGAGLSILWPQLTIMLLMGIVFLSWALFRFRSMLETQNT